MLSFGAFKFRSNVGLILMGEASRLSETSIASLLHLEPGCRERIQFASKNFTKDCSTTFRREGHVHLKLSYLKTQTSRNLGIYRADTICASLKQLIKEDDCHVVFMLKGMEELPSATSAIAQAFPNYRRKTGKSDVAAADCKIDVSFVLPQGQEVSEAKYEEMRSLASKVALAAELTDTAPTDLDPVVYARRVSELIEPLQSVKSEVIVGDDLYKKGLHTIWSVGKAAVNPSHLIILHYQPSGGDTSKSIAFVGKGITYDSGGLSIKATANMCGMKVIKMDMGGSAATLGAFLHLVEIKHPHPVIAALCIAENAVGPTSLKNDDIIQAYSGKTIEVNNTDAEGRLVLADGVSYITKHYKPTILIDVATLTGAQLVTTGKHFAAVLCPDEDLERKVIKAARVSGDLAFPMLYCPELLFVEFKSEVADMKNAAATQKNAPSSCAGHFIEQHLDEEWVADPKTGWVHLDIAGPSNVKERASGFGVSLLSAFAKDYVL